MGYPAAVKKYPRAKYPNKKKTSKFGDKYYCPNPIHQFSTIHKLK